MSGDKLYEEFDVLKVPLEGSNLIEASAGTGKTYSIAILVLRLLLEEEILLKEILMVTFTKAAVAELEERIRRFIREAYRYLDADDAYIENEQIKEIIEKSKSRIGEEKTRNRLKSAVINLDETAVMTIHGFCQQSLNEFAFETNQLFSAELILDTTDILENEMREFWRKNITTIQVALLNWLVEKDFSQESIAQILKEHLNSKNYVFFDPNTEYRLDNETQSNFVEKLSAAKLQSDKIDAEINQFVPDHKDELIDRCMSNRYAKNLIEIIDQPEQFIEELKTRRNSQYAIKLFSDIYEKIDRAEEEKAACSGQTDHCLEYLYSFAIQEITRGINRHKTALSLMSFDDMIERMNKALTKTPNPALEHELRQKYKAVFIDEFQDTDRLQYEIFEKAFQAPSIIFYIGDPKQSIYGWRKADIATYFEARNKVDQMYGMNVNYRSTTRLVEALNQFFQPEDNFDTFYYRDEKERVDYHNVTAPANENKGNLLVGNAPCIPITITTGFKNKSQIAEELAGQVAEMLTNPNYSVFDKATKKQRKIKPSDIGILVRQKKEGADIKTALSRLKIPSVTVTNAKILQSKEAKELVYVLEAVIYHNRAKVNRALLSIFTRWTRDDILQLNEEMVIQRFKEYHVKWRKSGIYAALMDFISDFNIQQKLLAAHTENGERMITNLFHLLEVLHKRENRQRLSPAEVLDWFKLNIDKKGSAEDEMEQRIESDEDAVHIVTIHSSKGLQYNVVFAPYMDFAYNDKKEIISFRDQDGKYMTARKNQVEEGIVDLHKIQEEQENRRLLYVTLTRAVYQCNIFKKDPGKSKKTTLDFFTDEIKESNLIVYTRRTEGEDPAAYVASKPARQEQLIAKHFYLKENNWTKMSYSSLAAHGTTRRKEAYVATTEDYDAFIFRNLKKGAKTGTFLHYIFEIIDFTRPGTWPVHIQNAVKRFMPNEESGLEKHILTLLHHVLNASLKAGEDTFKMSDIGSKDCLRELEFEFPVSLFTPERLSGLMESGIAIADSVWKQMEGIMNGKVDLFFRYKDKFFVLDWKSNYLGPALENYTALYLEAAMSENNYHLQYLIYTYAVRKYLRSRLGQAFNYDRDYGGVLYLFVRGMRNNHPGGVFFQKPTSQQLDALDSILKERTFTR